MADSVAGCVSGLGSGDVLLAEDQEGGGDIVRGQLAGERCEGREAQQGRAGEHGGDGERGRVGRLQVEQHGGVEGRLRDGLRGAAAPVVVDAEGEAGQVGGQGVVFGDEEGVAVVRREGGQKGLAGTGQSEAEAAGEQGGGAEQQQAAAGRLEPAVESQLALPEAGCVGEGAEREG